MLPRKIDLHSDRKHRGREAPVLLGTLIASREMANQRRTGFPVRAALAVLLLALCSIETMSGEEHSAPPRLSSGLAQAFTDTERETLVSWVMSQPRVKAVIGGHRTRLLRVWSDVVKGRKGPYRRGSFVLRDYDSGAAREITVDLSTGAIETRELVGVQPSREEIEEGMAIVRSDPALAAFVANPKLELTGGFHNRSRYPDDPCSREVCLDFAFMRPNYEGPARYVIVNLTRRVVANRDFRVRPGEAPPRMTKKVAK